MSICFNNLSEHKVKLKKKISNNNGAEQRKRKKDDENITATITILQLIANKERTTQ